MALAELAAHLVGAIEATAASERWRDLVKLAPGFAEEAVAAALDEVGGAEVEERRLPAHHRR